MKLFIAYTLVVAGLPIFIGNLLGMVFSFPISLAIGMTRRNKETPLEKEVALVEAKKWALRGEVMMDLRDRIAHVILDLFNGFWAVFVAGLIFHLFGFTPSVFILLIVVSWELFFSIAYKQAFRALLGSFVGAVIGWLVVLRLFSI
jgi:hypothetical protein